MLLYDSNGIRVDEKYHDKLIKKRQKIIIFKFFIIKMKRENPDISLSQKTTQNSKNNQTNNQPSLSEIRIENSEKTDEIFERLSAPSENNQAIQSEQTIQNNFGTKMFISFPIIS